jgi:hypothetical protein
MREEDGMEGRERETGKKRVNTSYIIHLNTDREIVINSFK